MPNLSKPLMQMTVKDLLTEMFSKDAWLDLHALRPAENPDVPGTIAVCVAVGPTADKLIEFMLAQGAKDGYESVTGVHADTL